MILFDLLFEFTAGALCAAADRERVRAAPEPLSLPSFRAGLFHAAFFYVPAAVLFVRLWPDWSSHYLFDAAEHPWAAAFFAYGDAASLFAFYIAGYLVTAQRIRRLRLRSSMIGLGAAWAMLLPLLFVVMGSRSMAVTTTAEFRAGEWPTFGLPWGDPRGLLGRPLMVALVVSGIWNAVPLALVVRGIAARSRR